MAPNPGTRPIGGWREWTLAAVLVVPLAVMMMLDPIRQDPAYHVFADVRAYCGVPNFMNAASNIAFLLAGGVGLFACLRRPIAGAALSWIVFFLGVAFVSVGSAYYHRAPDNGTLVWDRLPMTIAFMALFAGLLAEHLGARFERMLLALAVGVGIASVAWWAHADDLRLYAWVQFAPLLAIPVILAAYDAPYSHRRYLLYGLACYVLAKGAELYDREIFEWSAYAISGHSLKHLLAALAPVFVYRMLRLRQPAAAMAPAVARARQV